MTVHQSTAVIERINMREVLFASMELGSMTSSLRMLANADPQKEKEYALTARAEMIGFFGFSTDRVLEKPFAYADGLAFIPVHGMLVNRFGSSWSYITGYNFIRAQMEAAESDDEVKGIVFDVNSPGGEVAGCFELSREMKLLTKPTIAVVDSRAYSGGYALACACDKIIVIPSGGVGSVGVISTHMSYQKELENMGVEVTLIFAGDHKADANPYEKLPDSVKADMQASVEKTRIQFATLVAENRGMDVQAIIDTQAKCYRSDEALALGLIDAVATPADAVSAFFNELSGSITQLENDEMSQTTQTSPGAESVNNANNAALSQQQIDTASATARTQERTRISGILNCEEAKGRGALATHLATNTSSTVEEAQAILKFAAVEAAAVPAVTAPAPSAFVAAMNASPGPNVGADTQAVTTEAASGQIDLADQMLKDAAAVSGMKFTR